PNFNVPPPQFNVPPASQLPQRAGHHAPPDPTLEPRGWFGLAKKFVGINGAEVPEPPMPRTDRDRTGNGNGDWDIKSLLAAAEQRDRAKGQRHPQQPAQAAYHTTSRHMIETLQAMAIALDRFLEDDPPLDLLRRYRSGERNVFARRLVAVLGREQS